MSFIGDGVYLHHSGPCFCFEHPIIDIWKIVAGFSDWFLQEADPEISTAEGVEE